VNENEKGQNVFEALAMRNDEVMVRTLLMEYTGPKSADGVDLRRLLLHVRKIPSQRLEMSKTKSKSPFTDLLFKISHSDRIRIQHHNLCLLCPHRLKYQFISRINTTHKGTVSFLQHRIFTPI
jgi:hypothetical protein